MEIENEHAPASYAHGQKVILPLSHAVAVAHIHDVVARDAYEAAQMGLDDAVSASPYTELVSAAEHLFSNGDGWEIVMMSMAEGFRYPLVSHVAGKRSGEPMTNQHGIERRVEHRFRRALEIVLRDVSSRLGLMPMTSVVLELRGLRLYMLLHTTDTEERWTLEVDMGAPYAVARHG